MANSYSPPTDLLKNIEKTVIWLNKYEKHINLGRK